MNEGIDYYKLLDDLLMHYLKVQGKQAAFIYVEEYNKILEAHKVKQQIGFEATDKLLADGFIRKAFAGEHGAYMVTFDGHVFIQDGMYSCKSRRTKVKSFLNFLNIVVLFLAAIVGGILATFQIIDKDKPELQIDTVVVQLPKTPLINNVNQIPIKADTIRCVE